MKLHSSAITILLILSTALLGQSGLWASPPSLLDLYLTLPDGAALPGVFLMPGSTPPSPAERKKAVAVNDPANGYLKLNFGSGPVIFQTEVALFTRTDGTSLIAINQIEKGQGPVLSNVMFFQQKGTQWENITDGMMPELPSLMDLKEQLLQEKVSCVRKDTNTERLFELPRYGTTILLRISFPSCTFQTGYLTFDQKKGGFEMNEALCLAGDCANGTGTMKFPSNGNRYVGQFRNGLREGKGTLTSTMGDRYEGQWKSGKPDGQGTLTNADGSKYSGAFKNGKREGTGTSYTAEGRIEHQGRWSNDEYLGK